jgi:hypothetical protein
MYLGHRSRFCLLHLISGLMPVMASPLAARGGAAATIGLLATMAGARLDTDSR